VPGHAITYVIAGASGSSKAIPIQLVRQGSCRVEPYLRILRRAAYTIITPILGSFKTIFSIAL